MLPITLDTGATVSFARHADVTELGIPIGPNDQLAILADEKTRMASLGEIDTELVIDNIIVRLRALVMENLAAPCYGGTTFHTDNNIKANLIAGEVLIHGKYVVKQSNPMKPMQRHPPSSLHREIKTTNKLNCVTASRASSPTISVPVAQVILPTESAQLALPSAVSGESKIVIVPRFDNMVERDWPPQICDIVEGHAIYVNSSSATTISHPRYAHFQTLPVQEFSLETVKLASGTTSKKKIIGPAESVDQLIGMVKTNEDILTPVQKTRLKDIHYQNSKAFDGDLRGGYNQKGGRHYGSFTFKDQNKPPPNKVWAPQYNRVCADLHQAKCDELEEQGVLLDPKEYNIDILHVSPSFIQQKGRAKHKKLPDCTLDEIRFITDFNVLNENIRPISGRSTSAIDIFKFLGKWKFFIFADMFNSYFQIPMKKKLLGYLGIMTPFRGVKIISRAGQGLLNSDYELEQLLFRVLGDEILDGICMAARDDVTIGGNTIDEAISNWERVLS
jgi:hypothetical protein